MKFGAVDSLMLDAVGLLMMDAVTLLIMMVLVLSVLKWYLSLDASYSAMFSACCMPEEVCEATVRSSATITAPTFR